MPSSELSDLLLVFGCFSILAIANGQYFLDEPKEALLEKLAIKELEHGGGQQAALSSIQEKKARHSLHQKLVDEVNAKRRGWKAKLHHKLAELHPDHLKHIANGAKLLHQQNASNNVNHQPMLKNNMALNGAMRLMGYVDPDTFSPVSNNNNNNNSRAKRQSVTCQDGRFDVRWRWPQCKDIVSNVRDQSLCGNCWAVSVASAYTDRHCIQMVNKGKSVANIDSSYFAAADLMGCSGVSGTDGCNGADPGQTWQWIVNNGLVTGANYSKGGCKPYPFPTTQQASNQGVSSYSYPTNCPKTCSNGAYGTAYANDKAGASDLKIMQGAKGWQQTMMEALYYNGTINAVMTVYEDFYSYSSGVYTHTTGSQIGLHTIRLIGWGTVNCTNGYRADYWLGVNSWNTGWGQGGFFQIARGNDECGIESWEITYGTPVVV